MSLFQTYPARILAALVDLLMIRLLCGTVLPDFTWGLGTFLVAGAYFGVGNSELLMGSTPGKKLFGLKVLGRRNGKQLSLSQSFLRFLAYPGAVILLVELPEAIYRVNATVASPWLLQLNMFLAFLLFLTTLGTFFFGKNPLGIHDWLIHSVVVRTGEEKSFSINDPFLSPRNLTGILAGTIFSCLFWVFGLSQPEPVISVLKHKYFLEHNRPFVVAGSQLVGEKLEIMVFFLSDSETEELGDEVGSLFTLMQEQQIIEEGQLIHLLVGTSDRKTLVFERVPGKALTAL